MISIRQFLLAFIISTLFIQTTFQLSFATIQCAESSSDDGICTKEYDPVCAYKESAPSGTTVSNACVACKQQGYEYYIGNTCEEIQRILDDWEKQNQIIAEEQNKKDDNYNSDDDDDLPNGAVVCEIPPVGFNRSEVACTLELNPVCAYKNGSSNGTTVGNPCGACRSADYDYYLPGACEEDLPANAVRCDPLPANWNFSEAICTLEYNPVCGYYDGSSEGVTAGNPCGACGQIGVDYYVPGACEEQEEPIVRCLLPGYGVNSDDVVCPAIFSPVCASNDSNLENGVTISNSCQACSVERYSYYRSGECPANSDDDNQEAEVGEDQGDDGSNESGVTRCQRPDLSATNVACTLQYEPVCAYNDDDDSNEGSTVGNACQACLQQGFDYYTQGECENGPSNGGDDGNNQEVEVEVEIAGGSN